jgi:hypothetical protein
MVVTCSGIDDEQRAQHSDPGWLRPLAGKQSARARARSVNRSFVRKPHRHSWRPGDVPRRRDKKHPRIHGCHNNLYSITKQQREASSP